MNTKKSCEFYRNLLADELAAELDAAEKADLDAHLAACPACQREQEHLGGLFSEIRAFEDQPVPRHFFVYPEERADFLGQWSSLLSRWGAAVTAAVLLAVGALVVASNLQMRLQEGVLTLSFGRPLPPAFDPGQIQEEMLKRTGAQIAEAQRQWSNTFQQEWRESISKLSDQQKETVLAALAAMEQRMRSHLDNRTLAAETKMQRTINDAYAALSSEHERDLVGLALRLEEALLQGQIERNQTEEVLATLVQVVSTNSER